MSGLRVAERWIDLGDRSFEVMHLPGHSPGNIGLWEQPTGTLFTGDAIYDGTLLDSLPDSNIEHYLVTMERLRRTPARIVHGGHEPSFGPDRLAELIDDYVTSRTRKAEPGQRGVDPDGC